MQSVSSRIWTRVAVFISYDDNDYTTGTSDFMTEMKRLISWVNTINSHKNNAAQLAAFLQTDK